MTSFDEMSICSELELVPLEEAGGIISWIKRSFSGSDSSITDELSVEVKKISTLEEKKTVLAELDRFIAEAESSEKDGTFGDILTSLGLGSTGGVIGAVGGAISGSMAASQMLAPVVKKAGWFEPAKSTAARQAIATAGHKAAQFGTIVNKTLVGLSGAAIALAIITIIFRTVNRYNGNMHDYIAALRTLREQARQIKVS